MPELPDITIYLEAMERQLVGQPLKSIDVKSPFVLRTFEPDLFSFQGKVIERVSRIGKRIVWHFEEELAIVFHLMIAGRFHQKKPGTKKSGTKAKGRNDLIAFGFEEFTLILTEASTKKRAGLWTIQGESALRELDPGGLQPLSCSLQEFREVLLLENRTLKRALTNPRNYSGIGNAYSDEILHAAGLSPLLQTGKMSEEQIVRLYEATRSQLIAWIDQLRAHFGDKFPEKVTAFRPEMAVHGKHGEPCPVCDTTVQRIAYLDHQTNYCPRCQTGGTIYKDRSLSRLLKDDWPKTVEDWEAE